MVLAVPDVPVETVVFHPMAAIAGCSTQRPCTQLLESMSPRGPSMVNGHKSMELDLTGGTTRPEMLLVRTRGQDSGSELICLN